MNSILKTAKKYYDPAIVRIIPIPPSAIAIPDDIPAVATVPVKYEIENVPRFYLSSIIVMNTLNYQFWSLGEGDVFSRYEHNGKIGAMAMGTCFWDAWHSAIPEQYRNSDKKDIIQALSGTLGNLRSRIERDGIVSMFGDIPNPESRKDILLEVTSLLELITSADLIHEQLRSAKVDGEFLAKKLATYFPKAYHDLFLKKAQLTLMLALSEYRHQHPDATVDLNVTIAADYQIPKVLRSLGILEYSEELAARVDNEQLLESGSKEELAIRAASILAGEEMSLQFGVSVPQLDWWIWSHRNDDPTAKFHLTHTTDY